MRVKKVQLKKFKGFDDLTIDLGDSPKKIVALVGPNGCGKSSVFDAFEQKLNKLRSQQYAQQTAFLSKALYYEDEEARASQYNHNDAITIETEEELVRTSFYIRTAYRYTANINVSKLEKLQEVLQTRDEPASSMAMDQRLQNNYKRLLSQAYSEFETGEKTGSQVKEEIIGSINIILNKLLDIEITSIGEVFSGKGQLYFKKGNAVDFPYSILSAGEKEVVDIVIDLIVKTRRVYRNTAFCIDEPELHISTAIQRKLLVAIDKLIPDNCQLWIATHSIGFLRALQEDLKGKAQVIDFSKEDYFVGEHYLLPIAPTRANWQALFSTALEDLTQLLSPKRIFYCEGRDRPGPAGSEKGLDAIVYNNVFSEKYHETLFISSGGNTELDQRSEIAIAVLGKVFEQVEINVLKDRDMVSSGESTSHDRDVYLQNNPANHRVLVRRELENYLFDKEVLEKYCAQHNLSFDENAYDAVVTDIENQNIKDESGKIKNICGIATSINPETFKINLSETITEDMAIFSELEKCIFANE